MLEFKVFCSMRLEFLVGNREELDLRAGTGIEVRH
jgi:hypothetical protein